MDRIYPRNEQYVAELNRLSCLFWHLPIPFHDSFITLSLSFTEVTIIFKGNYNLEKQLPHDTADVAPLGLGAACAGCRANAFALAGYMEAYQETNGFAKSLALWRTKTDCYVSITGHGLGGMHSVGVVSTCATLKDLQILIYLLAHLVLDHRHLAHGCRKHHHIQVSCWFTLRQADPRPLMPSIFAIIVFPSHNYGAPRTLNPAAAAFHNFHLGGNQLDRGAANADSFMSAIPQSDEYTFTVSNVAGTYSVSCVSQEPDDTLFVSRIPVSPIEGKCPNMFRL